MDRREGSQQVSEEADWRWMEKMELRIPGLADPERKKLFPRPPKKIPERAPEIASVHPKAT